MNSILKKDGLIKKKVQPEIGSFCLLSGDIGGNRGDFIGGGVDCAGGEVGLLLPAPPKLSAVAANTNFGGCV